MTAPSPLAAEIAMEPHLTPVRPGDPALATILLLNAARRGFARLSARATARSEPDWPAFLAALLRDGVLPFDMLPSPTTHAAVAVLAQAMRGLDAAVVSHEYGRAFGGEVLAHEAAYLAHLDSAGAPLHVREALVARARHEGLLRDLEGLVTLG